MTSAYNKSRFGTQSGYTSVKYNKLSPFDDTSNDDNCLFNTSNDTNRSEYELKSRQNVSSGGDERHVRQSVVEYIPYEVKSGESLRAIALRYGCTVSQIKQLNHLMSDQEFYGLRVIKLPAKKYGILSDVLVHQINSQSHDSEGPAVSPSLIVNIGISQHLSQTNGENATKFLSHMDEDLRHMRQKTQTVIERSTIDNLEQNLTLKKHEIQFADQILQKRSAFLSCDESDYGINWFNLLLLAFVLCFLLPIVYVIYISESHNHNNNTNSVSNHHIYSYH